jgi:hypothetical protein
MPIPTDAEKAIYIGDYREGTHGLPAVQFGTKGKVQLMPQSLKQSGVAEPYRFYPTAYKGYCFNVWEHEFQKTNEIKYL